LVSELEGIINLFKINVAQNLGFGRFVIPPLTLLLPSPPCTMHKPQNKEKTAFI
jgi:hypothetical protein